MTGVSQPEDWVSSQKPWKADLTSKLALAVTTALGAMSLTRGVGARKPDFGYILTEAVTDGPFSSFPVSLWYGGEAEINCNVAKRFCCGAG